LNAEFIRKPPDAAIEELVVLRAACEPVVWVVWAIEVERPDMPRLETDRRGAELTIEATERALPIPRGEHPCRPCRAPAPTQLTFQCGHAVDNIRVETDGRKHVPGDTR
jgi:hypothetical protein